MASSRGSYHLSGSSKDEIGAKRLKSNLLNTSKANKKAARLFREFLKEKGLDKTFENYNCFMLNEALGRFYMEARKPDGTRYKGSSLETFRSSINRYLKSPPHNKKFNVMKDDAFKEANAKFRAVKAENKIMGLADVDHHPVISEEDIRMLYSSPSLSPDTPYGLANKVQFDIRLYFFEKGAVKMHQMKKSDFIVHVDPKTGQKYVAKTTDEKKKSRESDDKNSSLSSGVMPESPGSPSCPVMSFQKYLQKLHPMNEKLWQKPLSVIPCNSPVWFRNIGLGEKVISSFMTKLSRTCGLSKIYSNQSIRATGAAILFRQMVGAPQEMSFPGRIKSVQTLITHQHVGTKEKIKMGQIITENVSPLPAQLALQSIDRVAIKATPVLQCGSPVVVQSLPSGTITQDDVPVTATQRTENMSSGSAAEESLDDDHGSESQELTACHLCGLVSVNKPLQGQYGNASSDVDLVSKYFGPDLNLELGPSICPMCEKGLSRLSEIDSEIQILEKYLWERIRTTTPEGSSRFDKLYTRYLEKKSRTLCNQLIFNGKEGYFAYIDKQNVVYTGTPRAQKFLAKNAEMLTKMENFCRYRPKPSRNDSKLQSTIMKAAVNATEKPAMMKIMKVTQTGPSTGNKLKLNTVSQAVQKNTNIAQTVSVNVNGFSNAQPVPKTGVNIAQPVPKAEVNIAQWVQETVVSIDQPTAQNIVTNGQPVSQSDLNFVHSVLSNNRDTGKLKPEKHSSKKKKALKRKNPRMHEMIESELPSKQRKTTTSKPLHTEQDKSFSDLSTVFGEKSTVLNRSSDMTCEGMPVLDVNVKVESEDHHEYDQTQTSLTSLPIVSSTGSVYSIRSEPVPVMLVGNMSIKSEVDF